MELIKNRGLVSRALFLLADFARRFVDAHPGTWLALAIGLLAAIMFVVLMFVESVSWLWGIIGIAELILIASMAQETLHMTALPVAVIR